MSDASSQLRHLVGAVLHQRGMKQSEVAVRCGISQKHLSQALTGVCGMTTAMAEQILAVLGMDLIFSVVPSSIAAPASNPALDVGDPVAFLHQPPQGRRVRITGTVTEIAADGFITAEFAQQDWSPPLTVTAPGSQFVPIRRQPLTQTG